MAAYFEFSFPYQTSNLTDLFSGAIPHGSVWAEHLQAFLICIEMLGIGIAFYYSFSVKRYKGEGAPSFAPPVPRAQKRRFFSSIASVASMKDVFRDTVNSIARAPQVYVHIAGEC